MKRRDFTKSLAAAVGAMAFVVPIADPTVVPQENPLADGKWHYIFMFYGKNGRCTNASIDGVKVKGHMKISSTGLIASEARRGLDDGSAYIEVWAKGGEWISGT